MKDFTHLSDKSADAIARLAPETDDGVAVTAEFEPLVPPGPPPASVGRYKVTQWLGAGGFGIVYKAIDEQLQREVAIKIVLPPKDLPTDGDTLLSEARLMARLSHPAIVPIYDVGQLKDGSVFIVSKLIEGQDLSHLLKSRRLTHRESAALVAQIADALDYAHGQGIVHRDVKPKNILISSDSSPVLADFGLALQQSDYGRGPRFAGTPAYMSPEQARLEGHRVDGRSDVYSLGTVLYELLTGTRPFEAESVDELLDCIRTVEVRPPRQLDRQIPRELERICLKALSKRPADRYSTAGDLAEDLRQWQSAVAATAANTPTVGDKPQASDSAKSDRLNVVIVPRGLRPFEAVDADFFLELLPGARDRNGLPESVRFWKSRIEEVEAEQTFRAGLLLGPSGSGKSSLVRAGIIPQLDENVLVIVVDARPEHLDERLLARLKSRIPALSSVVSLAEGLRLVRQRRVLPAERKLLLVIDQFEQWLSAHDATSREALLVGESLAEVADIHRLTTKFNFPVAGNLFTKAGVEMALWDLLGKLLNKSIYDLLGGKVREFVRIKWSVSGIEPEKAATIARGAVERGFTAMKAKVGIKPEADVARVRAACEAIGDKIKLGVDANGGWKTVEVAVKTIRRICDATRIAFAEQPVPAGDHGELAAVCEQIEMPVIADESLYTLTVPKEWLG